MARTFVRLIGLGLAFALFAAPASAQIVQSIQLSTGAFIPRGYSARVDHDVLVTDLNSLDFANCHGTESNDPGCLASVFTNIQVSAEYLVAFGNHIELGAGVGFYNASAPTVDANYQNPDNSLIQQNLNLRIVPVSGVVRFLAGRPGRFQPYVGVGVSALIFRYTESGEFVDYSDPNLTTFNAKYTARGTVPGPLVLAGFRAPLRGDIWAFTMEWRHQWGEGNTGGAASGFLDDKIDLGGDNINFGLLVRF